MFLFTATLSTYMDGKGEKRQMSSLESLSRDVTIVSITAFLITFTLFSWLFLLPIYLKALGADDFSIGLSYTLFGSGFTLAQIVGGYFSDKFSRKHLIVIPTWFFPVFYFLMAISTHWIHVALFYFLVSICSALQAPSFTSLLAESSREDQRGRAFGLFELSIMLGISLGPLAGSLLVKIIKIKDMIVITALVSFLSAVIRQIALIEPVRKYSRSATSFILERNLIWFTAAGIFMFLCLSLTINGPFLTLYQEEVLRLNKSQINLIFGLASIPSALSSLLAGWLSDKLGSKKITATGIFLHALLTLLWANFNGNILILIFSFTFVQFFYVGYQVILTQITDERNRAKLIGFFRHTYRANFITRTIHRDVP